MRHRARRPLSRFGSSALLLGSVLLTACQQAPRAESDRGSSLRLLEPPPTTRVVIATLRSADAPLGETPDGILLSQLLQLCLSGGEIEVYAPDQTALLELQGLLSTDPGEDQMARLHELTGAEAALTGIFRRQDGAFQVELTLASTEASTEASPSTMTGSGDDARVSELVRAMAEQMRRRLGAERAEPGPACASDIWLPGDSDSLRALTAGRRRLWLSDPAAGAELVGRAAASEPNRVLPHLELAKTLLALGSLGRAREEAERAADLAAERPAMELRESRALAALLEGRPRQAAALQSESVAEQPGSAAPRFALVRTLLQLEEGEAAFAAIAELRSLPLGTYDRLRVELLAASAAESMSDLPGWRLLADTARDRARDSGFALLEAEAWISLGRAQQALGHAEVAHDAALAARQIYLRLSHRRQAAMALAVAALGKAAQGSPAEGRHLLSQAAEELRRERDPGNVASVLHNLGMLELRDGDVAAAETHLRESLDLRRSLADSVGAAGSLLRLADVEARRGRFDEIPSLYEKGLAILDEDGLSPREGAVALELAGRLGTHDGSPAAGSLVEATRRRVLEIAAGAGDRRLQALAHCDLGEALLAGGELASARSELEQGLALFGELEDASDTARARLLLAGVALETEQFAAATTLARQVLEWALAEEDVALEAVSRSLLAWCHLRLGQRDAAVDETALAREAASRVVDPAARLSVLLAAARLEATVHPAEEASAELLRLLAEARRLGLARTAVEIELAIGELEMARGEAAAGLRRLAKVAQQADDAGWGLLSRKARRAAGDEGQ